MQPTRKLTSEEQLPADQFHAMRIAKWKAIAEAVNKDLVDQHASVYESATQLVERLYQDQPMVWSHGHFKPNEVHKMPNGIYYLTDFCHAKNFPVGYELGFMIWADTIMTSNENTTYEHLAAAIQGWIMNIHALKNVDAIEYSHKLIRASLIERLLGTIYADTIGMVDMPFKLKRKRLELCNALLKDLLADSFTI